MRSSAILLAVALSLAPWPTPAVALDTVDCDDLHLAYTGPAETKTCRSGDVPAGEVHATVEVIEGRGAGMEFAVWVMRAGPQTGIDRTNVEDTISPSFPEGSISGWEPGPAARGFNVKRFLVNGVVSCFGFVKFEGMAQRSLGAAAKAIAGFYCAPAAPRVDADTVASFLGAIDY